MAASNELKALVEQMPNPDERKMYTTDIDKEKIERAIEGIHKGGHDNVIGLIDMLDTPGSPADVKPHYALRCLANHILNTGNEEARREFSMMLAGELANDRSNYVKGFLCQELQWAGRTEVAPALGRLLLDEALVEPAAMALVAIREGAAEQFRAAMPRSSGKRRLNILHGLCAVEDKESAGILRAAMRDTDPEIRSTAGWGLSRMGDPGSIDLLIGAADLASGWERIQATKHCLVLAEKLEAAGRKEGATKIYLHLRDTRSDQSEAYIRTAAAAKLSL